VVGRVWPGVDRQRRACGAELYAEDGTYQVTPFAQPMRGRTAILEYWTQVAATQRHIQFEYEVLAVTSEMGIARWRALFVIVPEGLETKLDGVFVIALDAAGRCSVKEARMERVVRIFGTPSEAFLRTGSLRLWRCLPWRWELGRARACQMRRHPFQTLPWPTLLVYAATQA